MSRPTDSAGTLTVPVGPHDHVKGPATAAATLVEYGDFQCPYCREAYPIVKQLQAELGARLRFAFRHFPLTRIHQNAEHAAEAAEAAAAQGAFWQMHDRLFERQFALEDENLVEYARELGLDADRLAGELAAGTYRGRVRESFMSGVKSGVNGTPTFFINDVRHDGSYDFATLLGALEASTSSSRS